MPDTSPDDDAPYRIHAARAPEIAVVASLPHSGERVPAAMREQLSPTLQHCLRNTDWFLPALYAFLPELGITMIEATHSRYVADPNRRPREPLLGPFFRSVVASHTAFGVPVYRTQPTADEVTERVARFHATYHRRLGALLDRARSRFGRVLLLDLHSFMGPSEDDVCLGDAHGRSASPAITEAFATALRAEGFGVAINAPFSGGYVVRHHGDAQLVHALQIELRYTNYLDCTRIEHDRPSFDPARAATLRTRLEPALLAALAAVAPRA